MFLRLPFLVLNRAFTATECVESQWAIAGNSVTELSVQELISCSKSKGCSGGSTLEALYWLQQYVSHRFKWISWKTSFYQVTLCSCFEKGCLKSIKVNTALSKVFMSDNNLQLIDWKCKVFQF